MYGANAYQQYKINAIETARPEDLTLMLYNGAVRFMKQAMLSIENRDFQGSNDCLLRAQDIIRELSGTLDLRYDISHSLRSIYDYVNHKLVEANIKKDKQCIEECLELIIPIRDAWEEAFKSGTNIVKRDITV